MRAFIQILSPPVTSLLIASSVAAQTATAPQQPPSQTSAPANDKIEDLTQTTLTSPQPTAPAATPSPMAPASPAPATPSSAPAATGVPSTPMMAASTTVSPTQLSPTAPNSEKSDCSRVWIREGFYMRIVSGPGLVSMTGDGPRGHVSLSGLDSVATITLGGSVARGVVLAGTLQASTVTATFKGGPFVNETVTSNGQILAASSKAMAAVSAFGLLVDWYPNPSAGWHAGLSGGLGFTSVVNQADDSTMFGTSTAGSLFGGYDWAVGSQWSMGLALVASGSTPATMKDKDGTNAGYRLRSFSLGLGASILYF